jgi:predicted NBD/HSP70 family sugar kinase
MTPEGDVTHKRSSIRDVGRLHRRLVLRALRDGGPKARIELARELGLSATTMTRVVAQLIEDGFATEGGPGESEPRVGRPSTAVSLAPEASWVVGVQVGAGTLQFGVCDLLGRPVWTASEDFDVSSDTPTHVLDLIETRINRLLAEHDVDRRRVLGIGVAAPGPVDVANRRNVLAINLGWRDVPFSDHIEAATGQSTVVDHNVRAMAAAEATFGGHADADPLLYVYINTGVGAGAVIAGEPFRPGPYGVTELGHLQVVEKGRRCTCGATGCLETVASEPYVAQQLENIASPPGDRPLTRLLDAVGQGDARAAEILDDLVGHLTTGLASAVNLLNPRLIVLGGMFEEAPAALFDTINESLVTKVFPVLRAEVRVERTRLGAHAGVMGAATVALDRYFYG